MSLDFLAPYVPHPLDEWRTRNLSEKLLAEAGEHYPVPRGEDDEERLAPIRARLEQMLNGSRVALVRVTLWVGDEPIGSRLTALYWTLRCIASHPEAATHVTLQGLGDFSGAPEPPSAVEPTYPRVDLLTHG